ncbi:hypothetical protein AOQ84DRAFT_329167 [Glonium stellatum]|uniref:Glutathione transferase n=1 Tax=Glonium stellatum TaxID=574774 RepID=A0A8E2JLP2_9PEZI|nr:hypothetical protein AOQ84DRAFT_329167 [Glonium stellatum]
MDQGGVTLQHHGLPPALPPALRTLQPATLQPLHQPQDAQLHHHALQSLASNLQGLDAADPGALFQQRFHGLSDPPHSHALQGPNPFNHGTLPHVHHPQQSLPQGYPQHNDNGCQFSILATQQSHLGDVGNASRAQPSHVSHLSQDNEFVQILDQGNTILKSDGQFEGLKIIPHPPDLQVWRERLFNVDDTIVLTEGRFQTYFPHIDNVYSHRSTQRYKRKPFVSHYWDCRLKGRPPGTKKSTDPEKKKRKRVARERDLCDVKIKITEYMAGAAPPELYALQNQQFPPDTLNANSFFPQSQSALTSPSQVSPWSMPMVGPVVSLNQSSPGGGKYYTIQRVNGNGGNGKSDGVAGPHKHTLEESDRVKKNSVIRWMMKNEKDKKKTQNTQSEKKTYHKKATGNASNTVKKHSKEEDLKLYGSCFCPFVQRVWISLEVKQIEYQYIEVDPYKKPQSLLDVNPRGLVPALRHGPTWSCHESTVLMEYLEDLNIGQPLLPPGAQTRATCRLWSDHINRLIIPSFYRFLQEQDPSKQISHAEELKTEIAKLVDAADPTGPFFLGPDLSFVDVQIAPWIIRLNRVLKPYRNWPEPEPNTRWARWVEAVEQDEHVQATTSTNDLYLDSYERYAENRPNTSQLANAVNSGRGLP